MQKNPNTDIMPGPDTLDQFKQTYLKQSRTWFTPDIILLTAPDGIKFVLKTWSERPVACRTSWCRLIAAREIKVYEKLRGMQGVPQLICKVGKYGFVMEWLDARPLPSRKLRDIMGLQFFEKLETIIAEMHKRGVAHGDLRRRNILRGLDGAPKLIDFETAVHASKTPGGGRMFKAICKVDQITLTKIRARYFPESMSEADERQLSDIPWHLAFGRFLRQDVYAPMTKKGRRKRAKRAER